MGKIVNTDIAIPAGASKMSPWLMLSLAILGDFILAGDQFAVAAVLGHIQRDLGFAERDMGLIQGAVGLTYALGFLYWVPKSRNSSIKSLLTTGIFGCGILMVVQSFISSFSAFFLARLAIGFFDCAIWMGMMKVVMEWFPMPRRGTAMGILLAATPMAISVDFWFGIPFADNYSWRAFFQVFGVVALGFSLFALLAKEGPYKEGDLDRVSADGLLRKIFSRRWVWIAIAAIYGDLFLISAMATWIIPNYLHTQNMDPSMAPTIGALMGISQIVLIVIGGAIGDRIGNIKIIVWGAALSVIVAGLAMVTAFVAVPVWFLFIPVLLCGAALLSAGGIFSMISERYGDLGPAAAGYTEFGGTLAGFVAPALMGVLISMYGNYAQAYIAFFGMHVFVLFMIISLLLGRRFK